MKTKSSMYIVQVSVFLLFKPENISCGLTECGRFCACNNIICVLGEEEKKIEEKERNCYAVEGMVAKRVRADWKGNTTNNLY